MKTIVTSEAKPAIRTFMKISLLSKVALLRATLFMGTADQFLQGLQASSQPQSDDGRQPCATGMGVKLRGDAIRVPNRASSAVASRVWRMECVLT